MKDKISLRLFPKETGEPKVTELFDDSMIILKCKSQAWSFYPKDLTDPIQLSEIMQFLRKNQINGIDIHL